MKILSALVAGGAAAAAVGLVRSGYERRHFVVEETSIYSEKIRNPRTLVFLTDLHDKEFGEANSQLLGSIRTIRPDLILIGGDIMVAKAGKGQSGGHQTLPGWPVPGADPDNPGKIPESPSAYITGTAITSSVWGGNTRPTGKCTGSSAGS